jgi:hypothetical protein
MGVVKLPLSSFQPLSRLQYIPTPSPLWVLVKSWVVVVLLTFLFLSSLFPDYMVYLLLWKESGKKSKSNNEPPPCKLYWRVRVRGEGLPLSGKRLERRVPQTTFLPPSLSLSVCRLFVVCRPYLKQQTNDRLNPKEVIEYSPFPTPNPKQTTNSNPNPSLISNPKPNLLYHLHTRQAQAQAQTQA